jgi:DNA polymerase III delta prime subunit
MNEHIIEYCLEYLSSDSNPEFGILITGPWGCGKTYLIKNLITKLPEIGSSENEVLSISLYGTSTVKEIDQKIFNELHPILSSKTMRMAGLLLKSAIKIGTSVDLNSDGQGDLNFAINSIDISKSDTDNKINKKVIIIDDLERCSIEPSLVLGYFSELVLSFGLKAIFVGNVEQIDNKESFDMVKEKMIGAEFTSVPDTKEAILHFIQELSLIDHTTDLFKYSYEIMQNLKCSILRILRQCFYNFKFLLNKFPDTISNDYLSNVFKIFMALFVQKMDGSIKPENIDKTIQAYLEYEVSFNSYSEGNKEKQYSLMFFNKFIPLSTVWRHIIFDGIFTHDLILEAYRFDEKSLNDAQEVNSNSLAFIMHNWRDLKKNSFESAYKKLRIDFSAAKYLNPAEIIHYTYMNLIFINGSLIKKQKDVLISEVISFIKKHSNEIEIIEDIGLTTFIYSGYGIPDENADLEKIKSELLHNNDNLLKHDVKHSFINELNEIDKNHKELGRNLTRSEKYRTYPVLSFVNHKQFVDKVLALSAEDQQFFIYCVEARYGIEKEKHNIGQEFQSEKTNIENMITYVSKRKKASLYNPYSLKLKYLQERLEYINSCFVAKETA